MKRYSLYLTVALAAFGCGVYFVFSIYFANRTAITAGEDIVQSSGGGEEIKTETLNGQQPLTVTMSEANTAAPGLFFGDKEILSYRGFKVSRQYKKRRFENGSPVDVPFAVIKKGNRQVFEFDAGLDDYDRKIRFELSPLLGNEASDKQLIIESTANRYWRYAVIELAPEFEVLFDSGDYPLMREIIITDLDGDGRKELIQHLRTFFYFGITARKGFATTSIIFSYDAKKRKYVFANPRFAAYLLQSSRHEVSIEDKIRRIEQLKALKSSDSAKYNKDLFDAVMDVFLTYLYTGKEKEAWRYFEEYDLPDKEAIRAEIKKYLADDTLYQSFRQARKP